MALIEIDATHSELNIKARWSVKINSKERYGLEDFEIKNLSSWEDALSAIKNWMETPVNI